MNVFKKIKNKLYYNLIEKHPVVAQKYHEYKNENPEKHKKNRISSWMYLMFLRKNFKNEQIVPCEQKIPVISQTIIEQPTQNPVEPAKNPVQSVPKPVAQPAPKPVQNSNCYPESVKFKRLTPIQIYNQIQHNDIISFDIFDTLIFRPFEKPQDLFTIIGCELKIHDFKNLRISAERTAREITLKPNRQIDIYDIYDRLSLYVHLDKELGIETELKVEMDLCFANPYMKELFNILKYNKKTIIATSDMYLPKDILKQLLKNCGYDGFTEIFVSCDCKCGKHNGDLQRFVQQKMGIQYKYVHIGDNFPVDVKASRDMGWTAIHYPNVNDIARELRPNEINSLDSSIYKGIVNAYIHNGLMNKNKYYQHGFIYGGILVAGYCQWINAKAKEKGIDKLLFMARDGNILYKAYNKFFNEIDNDYILWSRFASSHLTFELFNEEFFILHIKNRAYQKNKISIKEALSEIDISFFSDILVNNNVDIEQILDLKCYNNIIKIFYANSALIKEKLSMGVDSGKLYINEYLNGYNNICCVDIGWKGSCLIQFKNFLTNILKFDNNVSGFLAGLNSNEYSVIPSILDDINVYIFSQTQNSDLLKKHINSNIILCNMIFEIMFGAPHPSFLEFYKSKNEVYSLLFAKSENLNYEIINDIQDGIIDFIDIFFKHLGKYMKYITINPYTAYIPLNKIIEDSNYIYDLFKDYEMNALSGIFDDDRLTTIGQIMYENNLIKER